MDVRGWCFWTVVLEKTLGLQESPLDCKEIKPVHPKGNQAWISIGRTEAEAKAPILWPSDEIWFIGRDPNPGKDRRPEENRTTKDEMVGWHDWLNGHEFEQTLGDGEGQGSLACCIPWGRRVRQTEQLNNNSKRSKNHFFPLPLMWILLFKTIYLFMAAPDLCCCSWAFSSSITREPAGFSSRWLLFLQSTGSRALGLSSCGTWAYLSGSMWNLPVPEIKSMSPALAGRFITTWPPEKSSIFIFIAVLARIQDGPQWSLNSWQSWLLYIPSHAALEFVYVTISIWQT